MICQKQWQNQNENTELLTSLVPKPPEHHSLPFARKKLLVHISWGRFSKAVTIGILKNTQLRGNLVPRREAAPHFSKQVLLHLENLTFLLGMEHFVVCTVKISEPSQRSSCHFYPVAKTVLVPGMDSAVCRERLFQALQVRF